MLRNLLEMTFQSAMVSTFCIKIAMFQNKAVWYLDLCDISFADHYSNFLQWNSKNITYTFYICKLQYTYIINIVHRVILMYVHKVN